MTSIRSTPPRRLSALTILAVIGLILSAVLTQHFYEVRQGLASFKSFCNMGATMNCDAISASRWAELFAGLPLSSFAGGWFLAILIISLMARGQFWRRDGLRILTAFWGWGALLSVLYGVVMVTGLGQLCLYCLGVDAVNFIGLALTLSLKPEGLSKNPLDGGRLKTTLGVVAGSLVAFVGLLAAIHVEPPKEIPVAELVASVNSGPVLPVKLDEGLPSFGPANAAVTIVEFSDFQCPHCRKGAMFMHSLLNMYPRDLRVVFRNFPLDAKCNRGMQGGGGHQAACEAAKSVICAKEQGHESFKHQYETLFERQPEIASGKPTLFAKEAGLDMTKFESCMSSREADAKVAADVEEGINLGLRSTPTFFINGRKVEGAYPVEVWRILIDQLMTSARHAGG